MKTRVLLILAALVAGCVPARFDPSLGGAATPTGAAAGAIDPANPPIPLPPIIRPRALGLDANGNLLFTSENGSAGRIGTDRSVTTIATGLATPNAIVADKANNLYILETGRSAIKKVTPDGKMEDYAGKAGAGLVNGTLAEAKFKSPEGLAIDNGGTMYVADTGNKALRRIAPDGTVSTVYENKDNTFGEQADAAKSPRAVTTNASGQIFFERVISKDCVGNTCDGPQSIVKIEPDGTTKEFVYLRDIYKGTGANMGMSVDAAGNLMVADAEDDVRKIDPKGAAVTVRLSKDAYTGFGIVSDPTGNTYVACTDTRTIYKVAVDGRVTIHAKGQ